VVGNILIVSFALLLFVRYDCCRLQYHVAVAARSNKHWDAIPRFIEGAGSSSIDGASNKRASAVSVINNQSKEAFYARLAQTPLSALPYCRQRVTIVFRETANSSTGKLYTTTTVMLYHCIIARCLAAFTAIAREAVLDSAMRYFVKSCTLPCYACCSSYSYIYVIMYTVIHVRLFVQVVCVVTSYYQQPVATGMQTPIDTSTSDNVLSVKHERWHTLARLSFCARVADAHFTVLGVPLSSSLQYTA
jgi:hypothetical protein